ncbi:MAG: S8 family peptidase [Oscillospiraceae bacterium]
MKKRAIILALALLISAALPTGALAAAPSAEDDHSGYIVKLRESESAVRLLSNSGLDELSSRHGLYKADSLDQIERLGGEVEYYEPDCMATLFELPNDTYAEKQWNLSKLGVESAWSKGYTGAGVKVAIIDSGVSSLHEDFEGVSFERGKNLIDGSHDVSDEMGHGTFVAGVIAAACNNGVGIAGLCDEVTLVPLKSFSSDNRTSVTYIISAIYEAVDTFDCDVINLSLGMDANVRSLREAIDHANANGVIVVSAVGNSGTSKLQYPAAYENVIGVGSIDKTGRVTSFSQKNESVFVVAPGVDIISLSNERNNAYFVGEGTSYSAPHVTAAAIMLKQYAPSSTTEDFAELIKLSARDGGALGYDTYYGYGALDFEAFIETMESYDFGNIEQRYPDLAGHWAADSIDFCVSHKLFNGISESEFAPEQPMTRAMFVTVLSRMSGEQIKGFPMVFSDVSESDWFAQPAAWGSATGIVSGVSESRFDPNGSITREQMAAMLYRYANAFGLHAINASSAGLGDFSDGASVSEWAKSAMQWAVANGLITGRGGAMLCPQEGAKRCEVAAIIQRFISTFGQN